MLKKEGLSVDMFYTVKLIPNTVDVLYVLKDFIWIQTTPVKCAETNN